MSIRLSTIARRVIRAATRLVRSWVIGRVKVTLTDEPIRRDAPVRIVQMAVMPAPTTLALPAGAWDQPWGPEDDDWELEDYGWTPRSEVIEHLRGLGYVGDGFDAITQNAFNEIADEAYFAAEEACNGELLNKEGMRKDIHPRSLFKNQEARALKYASEELLRHWQVVGRLTVEQYRADLLEDGHAYRHTTFA